MGAIRAKRSFIEGPLFFKLLLYALPIMLTGLLQVLYNTADHIVVGSFSGDDLALAAVGSTGTLTNLLVNVLMGVATGGSVVIAQSYGAGDYSRVSRAVHTTITFAIFGGIAFCLLGLAISEPVLTLMGTKTELMSRAVLYFDIICIGIPGLALYNFSASVLRAIGDSKTPLIVLSLSGLVNVGLNLFFVIVFSMSVMGVALATIISQYISAIALIVILIRRRGECYGITPKKLGIDLLVLKRILRYGIPTGFQSSIFSLSNIIIVTAGNSLPTAAVSARTIVGNIDSFVYTAMNCYAHASLTFVGQNFGAGKIDRVKRSAIFSLLQAFIVGFTLSQILLFFNHEAIALFLDQSSPNAAEVERVTREALRTILTCYVLCGMMETLGGCLRGIGMTLTPVIITILGACGIRMIWIFCFFYPMAEFNNLSGLYLCYPISWICCILAMGLTLILAVRRLARRQREDAE